MSPSLRGSGLKFPRSYYKFILAVVSLFTREWIEMITSRPRGRFFTVSLFTREWIEILKNFIVSLSILVSLFTREWIEM